ncbi:MAG: hypothetical protein QXL77_06055 [Candidatus Bathyarchaeia archaeon]
MDGVVKPRKLLEMKSWFQKNWKKTLSFGLPVFGVLSFAAFTQGVGYHASINLISSELIIPGHPCYGYLVKCNVTRTYNPLFYPVTCFLGYKDNFTFVARSDPYDSEGTSVKKMAEITVALEEYPRNIPFYILFGFIVSFGLIKLSERIL